MKLCVHLRKMFITLLTLLHDIRVDWHTKESSIIFRSRTISEPPKNNSGLQAVRYNRC